MTDGQIRLGPGVQCAIAGHPMAPLQRDCGAPAPHRRPRDRLLRAARARGREQVREGHRQAGPRGRARDHRRTVQRQRRGLPQRTRPGRSDGEHRARDPRRPAAQVRDHPHPLRAPAHALGDLDLLRVVPRPAGASRFGEACPDVARRQGRRVCARLDLPRTESSTCAATTSTVVCVCVCVCAAPTRSRSPVTRGRSGPCRSRR